MALFFCRPVWYNKHKDTRDINVVFGDSDGNGRGVQKMGSLFGTMFYWGINFMLVLLLLLPILVMLGMFVLYIVLDVIRQIGQRRRPL